MLQISLNKIPCKFIVSVILDDSEKECESDKGNAIISGDGLFHKWGTVLKPDSKNELIGVTVGIVESCGTGKVYSVHPDDIQFFN